MLNKILVRNTVRDLVCECVRNIAWKTVLAKWIDLRELVTQSHVAIGNLPEYRIPVLQSQVHNAFRGTLKRHETVYRISYRTENRTCFAWYRRGGFPLDVYSITITERFCRRIPIDANAFASIRSFVKHDKLASGIYFSSTAVLI